MQEFFDIAKSDFTATFGGAFIFPVLLLAVLWILWQEKDRMKKILLGVLPLVLLFIYWCPATGILFMRLLGENVYWRILWLILIAVVIPYGACLAVRKLKGIWRQGAFLLLMVLLAVCGKRVLSEEWFEASTNEYKIPQYVIDVCEVLPEGVHAMVSNRLMPYIRLYDPSVTLEYGRNSLAYNEITWETTSHEQLLYLEAQKPEIDLSVLGPLAKEVNIEFLVFSSSRTYIGDWEDYGYREYGHTDEFTIFADVNYEPEVE